MINANIRTAMRCVALAAAALFLASCADFPRIPVNGAFNGAPVNTTVDSTEAKYLLETWLAGGRTDSTLDARIAALADSTRSATPGTSLSRDALAAVADSFSVDFAALFFADHLLRSRCNAEINRRFAAHLERGAAPHPAAVRFVVLFAPGWDYAANGQVTGADFREPRRLATEFGLENHLVPLPPTGSVETNARMLGETVRQHAGRGKGIIIAGASSAGPAIHLALGSLLTADERRDVKAWLNLGGILQGSPLVDMALGWPQVWLLDMVAWSKGWSRDDIASMSAARSRSRFAAQRLDADLVVINYLGIPLSGQIGQFASDKYPLLRTQGPNDGLTLLADAVAPDSLTIVAFGRDHFFADDPRINAKTLAMMALVVDMLDKQDAPRCD